MAFDAEAITGLYSAVVSAAKATGAFSTVVQHEPRSAPQSLPAVALWLGAVTPVAGFSGAAATAARVELSARVYLNALAKPEDTQDLKLLGLASTLIGVYTSGFTLNGEAAFIDLLGAYGSSLSMTPGWLTHDDKLFRVAELTIPIILDEVWSQTP